MKIRFNQPENKVPSNDQGERIQYGKAKRPGKPWRWYLILTVASLPLLYLLWVIVQPLFFMKANGRVNVPLITVRSSSEGYVQQMFIKPLQIVTKGDKLALLTNTLLDNNYKRLQNEIDFLDKKRDELLHQSGNASSSALILLNSSKEQKNFYLNRFHQYEYLFKQGAATQAEIATARNQYNNALENYVLIERSLLKEQNHSSDMHQVGSRISQLTLELNKTQDKMQQLLLTAPAKGLISELFVRPGEYLGKGQPLLDIIFPEKAHITAFIPPKYQDHAVVNQIATVTFPNGEMTEARITSVPGITQKSSDEDMGPLEVPRSAILAEMEIIEPTPQRLFNGMPVSIRLHYFSK